jgi:hypothetical protein
MVSIAALLVGTHHIDTVGVSALFSATAFLFGVLLAFSIQRMRDRLSRVQDVLSLSNSNLLAVYFMAAIFEPETCQDLRDHIDAHLTDQISYQLLDYDSANPSYDALMAKIMELQCQTKEQQNAHKKLLEIAADTLSDRASIQATARQPLSAIEWIGMLSLLVLMLILLALLPGTSDIGVIVVGVLAGVLVMLMSLLRKLDRLRWHERVTIWEPSTRLFRRMGLDPFVPRPVIESGRYRPTGRVRVVDFPDPYPDRRRKFVTLEDFGFDGVSVKD